MGSIRLTNAAVAAMSPFQKLMTYHADRIKVIPDVKAQGVAIKWLLENYDPAECISCYEYQLTETWRSSPVSWLTVKKNIGDWKIKGGPLRHEAAHRSTRPAAASGRLGHFAR